MRFVTLLLIPLCACNPTPSGNTPDDTDTGSSGDTLPGVDVSGWRYSEQAPSSGDTVLKRFVFGGDVSDGQLSGHWTEWYLHAQDETVLCAATWRVTSTAQLSDQDCVNAWEVQWQAPTSPGGDYCEQIIGYDLTEIDLSFYDGLGWQGASSGAQVCVREEGSSFEYIDGYTVERDDDSGFVLTVQDSFVIE